MTLDHEQRPNKLQDTLDELLKFPLMEALTGRRSRRFCMSPGAKAARYTSPVTFELL